MERIKWPYGKKITPLILICAVLCSSCVAAGQVREDKTYEVDFEVASVSALVVNVTTGETLYSDTPNRLLTPASTTKLVTTATALKILGTHYQYETDFYYRGKLLENGHLAGDIVVVPSGDPSLGSVKFQQTHEERVFEKVYDALVDKGITQVDGEIVVETSYGHPPLSSGRLWEDMGNYYGAAPEELNFLDNTLTITLQSTKRIGDKVKVVNVEPDHNVEFQCFVVGADNRKDSAYVYGVRGLGQWYISGSIPVDRKEFKIKGAMPNPEALFKKRLNSFLKNRGVSVLGEKVNKKRNKKLFYKWRSPELMELARETNQHSNNLYADALFKTIGKEKYGSPSWDNGVLALSNYWNRFFDYNRGFKLFDGSGLSPKGKLSARGMVNVLIHMYDDKTIYQDFKSTLAVGGLSGTLSSMFKNSPLEGRVYGKSGSMDGVLSYAGYVDLPNGEVVAFCIVLNNFSESYKYMRTFVEQLLEQIVVE